MALRSGRSLLINHESRNVMHQGNQTQEGGGPPGTRTRNLRIKSPLLCQIELEARGRIAILRRASSSSGRILSAVEVAVVEIRQPRVHALEVLHQLRAPAVPLADRSGEMLLALTDLGLGGSGGERSEVRRPGEVAGGSFQLRQVLQIGNVGDDPATQVDVLRVPRELRVPAAELHTVQATGTGDERDPVFVLSVVWSGVRAQVEQREPE